MLSVAVIFVMVGFSTQAGISFPDLRGGVLLSGFPGLSPPAQSWGNCHNEQGNRFRAPRSQCCITALKDDFGFTEDVAKELLRLASQTTGATPPLALGSRPVTADLKSRKAMCIVAVNCHCKITQDWCSNRDKKKTKSDKKKDTKEGEESDE
eukprot:Seg4579.1 transcript_id=Seg4579.1/GoldUCD/mRNA.D3Y31 product="hypothetical protein" protein_id=Seg4579.1/GoldUCD/D3Y31